MFNIDREIINWGGQELVIETGKIARQADGAALVKLGETTVLATVVSAKEASPNAGFLPLTVQYQEKYYAAGKVPGGYFKREGKPSEREVLISRLIDRPIRPLFAKGYNYETQVIATLLSYDQVNSPDIVSIIAVSAALSLSGIPFNGPIGAARVGYIDGNFVTNPPVSEQSKSDLDLVVAGVNEAVLMVESEAKELSEETMLEAVIHGHKSFQPVLEAISSLASRSSKPMRDFSAQEADELIVSRVSNLCEDIFNKAVTAADKNERSELFNKAYKQVLVEFEGEIAAGDEDMLSVGDLNDIFANLKKQFVRTYMLKNKARVDGRSFDRVRQISSEVGLLSRSHGSALFTRGETQALVVVTLGTGDDVQYIDSVEGTNQESFYLHYNFPPFSVGEVRRMMGPGRREIGHGKLAWRALKAVMPSDADFPYTVRVVSEITESNGSSSMATVCGASLALMDAGVPLKKPVAGVAMGLVKQDEDFAVLSDILGDEDHLGDMDFKVAGTSDGVTSLQMDIKITGISADIMKIALEQARASLTHILGEMSGALDAARGDVGQYSPRITTMSISPSKIGEVIGSGGKIIKEITATTGTKIDIAEDGTIKVAAVDKSSIEKAINWINSLTIEPEKGAIYNGKVVKIVDFGAFVSFCDGKQDGLIHISQIANKRVNKVSDYLSEGDLVKVKLVEIDRRGKVRLSLKDVDQQTGEEINH